MLLILAHELGPKATLWQQYWGLLKDPAHWLLELTIMILVDGLIMGVGAWAFKRWLLRHDREVHNDQIYRANND